MIVHNEVRGRVDGRSETCTCWEVIKINNKQKYTMAEINVEQGDLA